MSQNYFRSHRHPVNIVMHVIGIPVVVGAFFMFSKDWRWALIMLLSGIFIQEIGHSFEKN